MNYVAKVDGAQLLFTPRGAKETTVVALLVPLGYTATVVGEMLHLHQYFGK